MFSIDRIKSEINTKFLGQSINYINETFSTNSDAWEYLSKGCQEGTLIITDNQQNGRGRRQNKWFSSSGKSLTYSFILYPKNNLDKIGLLPLITGISIVRGINSVAYIQAGLKWPNDIMIGRRKMGGILIESKSTMDKFSVVVGVGLNINEIENDLHESIQDYATSLKIYSGENYFRECILAEILNEFEKLYNNTWDDIIFEWNKYCIHKNSVVCFHSNDKNYEGIFQGITANGYAKISIKGEIKIFPSGILIL